MIRLNLSRGPEWVDLLPGLRLRLAPLTTSMMMQVRSDPDLPDPGEVGQDAYGFAFTRALARAAIVEWDGVGDEAGAPLPVTADAVNALLDHWPAFEAFQLRWAMPQIAAAEALSAEKNGSPLSPTGSLAGAGNTAGTAKRSARRRARTAQPG